jgi:hypothetical protein
MNTIAAKQARSGMVRRRPPVGRARRGWEQGLDQRPELVRYEVVSKGRHGAGSCQT